MLCKVCGSQIPDNSKECEFCGAVVGDESKTAPEETKVIDTDEINNAQRDAEAEEEIFDDNARKRRQQLERMAGEKQRQLEEIEKRRNEKKQRQKRKKIAIAALICALVVAAAGCCAYYVLNNINNPDPVAAVSPTPALPTPLPTPTADPNTTPVPSPDLAMTPAPNVSEGSDTAVSQVRTAGTSGGPSSNVSSSQGSSSQGGGSQGSGGGSTSSASSSSGGSASSGSGSQGGGTSSSSSQRTASVSSTGSSSAQSSGSSQSSSATNSGIVSDNISSRLSVGGEVIYNQNTGRYLMTFISNGVKYYANVSAGSTTDQIRNKSYTITAVPTGETYNGNTVYEITNMTGYTGDYIIDGSGTRVITESDIAGMSKYDLALARNEIYARHGRKFQTPEFNAYFSSKSWYKINPNYNYSDDDSNLNEIEQKNVQFILAAESR